MKIGHIGDLHFGIKSDSSDFHNIHIKLVDWIVEQFLKHGVKKIIFYGDLFHNRNEINVKTLNIAYKMVKKLSDVFECFFIVGNHDTYYKSEIAVSSINIFKNFPNIHIITEPTEIDNFLLVPWIISDRKFYKWLRSQEKTWDYICGHFEFKGAQISQEIHSWQGMNAKIIEKFANKKVLSGHFHLKRHFSKKTFYIGSPLSLTWADTNEEKSIYVLDNDELIEINNDISPKFVKIPISKLDKQNIKQITNNFVKIIIDITIDEMKLQQLTDLLRSKNPASLQTITMSYNELYKIKDEGNFELTDPWVFIEKYIESLELPENMNKKKLLNNIFTFYREAQTI